MINVFEWLVSIFQFVLLLPVTLLVWVLYILPMWLIFRDLRFVGFVRIPNTKLYVVEFRLAIQYFEPWHAKMWRDWAGWSGPSVMIRRSYGSESAMGVLNVDSLLLDKIRIHELEHCRHQFVFGPLFYPVYFFMSIWIFCFNKDKHAYLDNPFERMARREADQLVDIPKDMWKDGPTDRWPWW